MRKRLATGVEIVWQFDLQNHKLNLSFEGTPNLDYHALLQRFDDPRCREYPDGFDYDAAAVRFATFAEALSTTFAQPLKTESGSDIQDASFHSQIYLPLRRDVFALIRFSNFGDMVTVSEDEPIPHEIKEMVIDLLTKHDYLYVPPSVLEQPYTGKNPGVSGIRNWWIRFFDWV